jgi:hypothetical protein
MTDSSTPRVPGVVWLKKKWGFKHNPFPGEGIARLGGEDIRENGLLFRADVQPDQVDEAIQKFVLGAAFSGLKFGYLWSLGGGLGGEQRGFGKSSLLQYLVEETNKDFGRRFFLDQGLDEDDAEEHAICAALASFDMANARSLAAVFFEATRYACRFSTGDHPTLAERLRTRLIERVGSDDKAKLVAAVNEVSDRLRGRTLGPPNDEFIGLLCSGDQNALGRHVESVKAGARARVGAANYLASFLLFAKAAGVKHVLLGCDQLEDFAATSTTRQKRTVETERFRDYVLELLPMADMLTTIVTLHPRAAQAIGDMWRLADLPSFAPDRDENRPRVVVLEALETRDQAAKMLQPYLQEARVDGSNSQSLAPFTDEAIDVLFDRSHGKPRDLLRKAHALVQQASDRNAETITPEFAAPILDSLVVAEDEDAVLPGATASPVEEQWTY